MVVGGIGAHYSTEIYENGVWTDATDAPESVDWFGRLMYREGNVLDGGPILFTGGEEAQCYFYSNGDWLPQALDDSFMHEDWVALVPDNFLQNC